MGYTPNAVARGLVKKNTEMIALLIPDITNPFYPEVARGVEDYARKMGIVFFCVIQTGMKKMSRNTLQF